MRRIWIFIWAIVATSPALAATGPSALTVYDGASIVDGSDVPLRTDTAIVVEDDHIRAVLPGRRWRREIGAAAAARAKIIGVHGLFAVPGLIDSHVHLATDPDRKWANAFLRRDLYSGITAVRDMAGDARFLSELSRETKLNEIPGPQIFFAALMAGPAFFQDPRTVSSARGATPDHVPWLRAITANTDLKLAVAEAHGTGATAIKIYADLDGSLVKSIADEAHRQKMLVWSHAAVFPASPRQVVEAGVDVMSHVCMLAYQAGPMPSAYHNRPSVDETATRNAREEMDALYREMKRRGTIMDATLYVYDAMWRVPNAQPKPYCTLAFAEEIAAAAHRAGVSISAGTDADTDWNAPLPALFNEVELLVKGAKLSPAEAIDAATRVSARAIGEQEEMGAIAAGKRADIVFVSGNPLDDIRNLRRIVFTLKGGKKFDRRDYVPISKAEAGER